MSELRKWWLDHATAEADATIAKMEEYGSGDLVAIGYQFATMANRELSSDVEAMELGCTFYLLGKIARITSAVERGDRGSSDTWFDIAVYAKMVLAAREEAWPV